MRRPPAGRRAPLRRTGLRTVAALALTAPALSVLAFTASAELSAAPAAPAAPAARAASVAPRVGTQQAPEPQGVPDPPDADPPPGEGLSSAVAALPLTSPELDRAERALESLQVRLTNATGRLEEIAPALDALTVEVESLTAVVARRDEQVAKAEDALQHASTAVREIAVEWFITGFGALDGLDPALTGADMQQLAHEFVLSEAGAYAALDDERSLRVRLDSLRTERADLDAGRAERAQQRDALERERVELTSTVGDAEQRLPELEATVTLARMGARVEGTNLSATALDAYWRADRALAALSPACGVTWWVLAGIGWIESMHGTYRGSALGTDGLVDPKIFGPLLDGSLPFAIVPDSDGGALDGTAATDRATGPMQFIPGTWRTVGTDGDGDGVADPQNLFDAAVSAGVYLCRSGPGLEGEQRLRAALLTYNRSQRYVDEVLVHAGRYRDALDLVR